MLYAYRCGLNVLQVACEKLVGIVHTYRRCSFMWFVNLTLILYDFKLYECYLMDWEQGFNRLSYFNIEKSFCNFSGCYKLESEPWFEGFGRTLWYVRTQTKDQVIF